MNTLPILIVDDDCDFRKTLSDILRLKGYDPLEAESGVSALEMFERASPMVVVIDIKLPDMSGVDVLRTCRLQTFPPECILLTGYASQSSAIEAVNSGAYSYVQKPFDIEHLLVTIHRAIEKHQADCALRESEEKYRTLVQTIPDLITTIDKEGSIQYINHPFPERSIEELVGTCFYDYLPVTQQEQMKTAVEQVFAHKSFITYEHVIQSDADTEKWFTTCAAPIQQDGQVVAVTLIARDISERKQAEHRLQHLNAELEERVKKRTERLEETNKALNDFAYSVSHDLKAPLRGIARLAEWLIHDYGHTIDVKGTQMLDLLRSRVLRMDSLIEGILRYSRAGRQLETVPEIDLNRLIRECVDSVVPSDRIQLTIARNLPVISGDPIRLQQVFQNLLSNAVKFIDTSEGQIAIRFQEEGESWLFSIADNGPGIERRHYDRVFQIFQTLETNKQQRNTGIGLALVKKIVELHGGRIWLESEPGSGSTFYFTLPKDRKKQGESALNPEDQ